MEGILTVVRELLESLARSPYISSGFVLKVPTQLAKDSMLKKKNGTAHCLPRMFACSEGRKKGFSFCSPGKTSCIENAHSLLGQNHKQGRSRATDVGL